MKESGSAKYQNVFVAGGQGKEGSGSDKFRDSFISSDTPKMVPRVVEVKVGSREKQPLKNKLNTFVDSQMEDYYGKEVERSRVQFTSN